MKLFSNLWASVAMLSMLALATSCETITGLWEQPTTPAEPEYVTVSLGLDVELDYEYEPLTRAEENNDLYGIQVYSTLAPATESSSWTKFAYGLFDTTNNLTINLIRGYEYKFVAAMVKDGKEKLSCYGGNSFLAPFAIDGWTPISNAFIYDHNGFGGLGSGYSYLKNPNDHLNHPNIERYYGELVGYMPGDNDSKATIELKRTCFGAKYIAKGNFAANGALEILMSSAPQLNLNLAEGNEVSEIYTFSNVRAAWLDENYTETISVTLRLAYADGTTEPLGTHSITFKRNTTTVVNVDLSVNGENGVGIEVTESGEMPEGTEITIRDGEIVDTNVEAN